MKNPEGLKARAKALRLHGQLAHWTEVDAEPAPARGWIEPLLDWEEQERARRSLERRLQEAHIGRFKSVCDFDWTWPKRCDRATFEALMSLDFLKDATNVVMVGPNGVGKTTLARNLAHQALIHGHTVLFTSAGQLLGDLAALDSDSALRRRLRHYTAPTLLMIDEVGYLSYSNRHADLLFELISRRYEQKSTVGDHQSAVRRMVRRLPQCRLRRLHGRSPDAQRRNRRHRRRILPRQGSPRTTEQRARQRRGGK
jgi:DNA replication protein DnaC